MLSRTRWYKNCHNISSLQFFNSKPGRMLCNSCINRFCDFYIFPIVGIGAINFYNKKTGNPSFFSCVFSLQTKWKNYFISIFINYTIWLTFLWRICVSIVQGFPSRAFLKQRLAQSSTSTKTIPRSSIRQQPRIYRGPAILNFILCVQCVMNAVTLIQNEMPRKLSNANGESAKWFLINTPPY